MLFYVKKKHSIVIITKNPMPIPQAFDTPYKTPIVIPINSRVDSRVLQLWSVHGKQ